MTTQLANRPARALKRTGRKVVLSKAAEKDLLKKVEEHLGRDGIAAALCVAGDSRAERFVNSLLHPVSVDEANYSIVKIASDCDITARELFDWIRRGHIDLSLVLASRHVPQLMEDIAVDSLNNTADCWRCDGEGTILVSTSKRAPRKEKCAECHGSGKITTRGDTENRKIMLETQGILSRRGPLATTNINFGGPVDSFEALVGRANDIIDAQAVPVPAQPGGNDNVDGG